MVAKRGIHPQKGTQQKLLNAQAFPSPNIELGGLQSPKNQQCIAVYCTCTIDAHIKLSSAVMSHAVDNGVHQTATTVTQYVAISHNVITLIC